MGNFRLVETLRNKLTWASGESTYLQRLESQLANTRQTLSTAFQELSAVDVYHHDSNSVQDQLQVSWKLFLKINFSPRDPSMVSKSLSCDPNNAIF